MKHNRCTAAGSYTQLEGLMQMEEPMDKIKRSLPKGVLCDGKQSRAPVIAYSCCLDQAKQHRKQKVGKSKAQQHEKQKKVGKSKAQQHEKQKKVGKSKAQRDDEKQKKVR
eukprot:1158532-Pelagomonas_calceolata.AAC.1